MRCVSRYKDHKWVLRTYISVGAGVGAHVPSGLEAVVRTSIRDTRTEPG